MPNLLNIHTPTKRNLLPRITLRSNPMNIIPQITSSDRRVMAYLLTNELTLFAFTSAFTYEQFAKEGIKWFLDAGAGIAASVLLAAEA